MQWSLVVAVFLAKAVVFVVVALLSLMLGGGRRASGPTYIQSGLRGESVTSRQLRQDGELHVERGVIPD